MSYKLILIVELLCSFILLCIVMLWEYKDKKYAECIISHFEISICSTGITGLENDAFRGAEHDEIHEGYSLFQCSAEVLTGAAR